MRRIAPALAIIGLALACGGKKSPTEPTTTPTITLGAPTTAAPLNASIPITATVRSTRGTLVNDVVVHFVTTYGALSAWDVPTKNGVATTMLATGSVPGTAEITATIGSDAAAPLRVAIGGGATPSSLELSPCFNRLPSTGGTVVFTATAFTGPGADRRFLEGVLVAFHTTAGTLSNTSATTNSLGRAHTTLTTTETAFVTASVGGATSGPLRQDCGLPVVPRPTVTMTVAPASAAAGEAITATVVRQPPPGPGEVGALIEWGDAQRILRVGGQGLTLSHGYAAAGEYLIAGIVQSTAGEVVSIPPFLVRVGPQRRLGLVFDYFTAGARFSPPTHTFTVFPRRAANPTAVRIEFGDGTSQAIDPVQPETRVNKFYVARGAYTVRVIQTNADGTTETASVDVVRSE